MFWNSEETVRKGTPQSHVERGLRVAAAREVDIIAASFPDNRPWMIDAHVEQLRWPEDHAPIFDSAEIMRTEAEDGSRHLLMLEHLGHSDHQEDMLVPVVQAWEAAGRLVYRQTEAEGRHTVTEIWSKHDGIESVVKCVLTPNGTHFEIHITAL